jgi:serine/threonine protein kinase
MKQVCLICERTSPDSNLYCQEVYCPAELSPTILDYGEWLGDIEIIKPLVVLRSSVIYEAQHHEEPVLLKVAHPGADNTERIKREAELLKHVQNQATKMHLPVLRAPYVDTSFTQHPYGRAMLREQLLYFCIYDHFEGESLRDRLTKTPQPWITHVGWIVSSLAYAVAFLHSQGVLHCNISPESVLVHFDKHNVPHILLADLGVTSIQRDLPTHWHLSFAQPAYIAPELLQGDMPRIGYTTDVYGIGLTMYEMLIGKSAFTFKLQSDDAIYDAILNNRRERMNREEDVAEVARIATRAVTQNPQRRFENAAVLEHELTSIFGVVPEKKQRRWLTLRTISGVVVFLLTLAIIITLAVTLWEALT